MKNKIKQFLYKILYNILLPYCDYTHLKIVMDYKDTTELCYNIAVTEFENGYKLLHYYIHGHYPCAEVLDHVFVCMKKDTRENLIEYCREIIRKENEN